MRPLFLLLISLVLIILPKGYGELRSLSKSIKSDPTLIPPEQLSYFTFGFREILADLLWLRSIQDLEFCGAELKELPDYENKMRKVCTEGWSYSMLDAITRLVPRYQIVYSRGAVALGVIVNDREGARKLYDKGVEIYPEDYFIHYASGYHYLFELGNEAIAAERFQRAALLPDAPSWVSILAAKLYSKAGRAELGIKTLQEFYKDQPFEEWPERAKERYGELQLQLKEAGGEK